MVITGLVLAGLAALIHVYIFFLESVAWTSPTARATFGTTAEEAEATKSLAFNQGFYTYSSRSLSPLALFSPPPEKLRSGQRWFSSAQAPWQPQLLCCSSQAPTSEEPH